MDYTCTSMPACRCSFCVRSRKEPSPKQVQDALADAFMIELERKAARLRARRIGAHRESKRNEPIYHRHHGRLCDLCHFRKPTTKGKK
jgi:hypothetical protein